MHNKDCFMTPTSSKPFDYSDVKDQTLLPYLQWLSGLTAEQKQAFTSSPTVASEEAGRGLMSIQWTTAARFACNRNKDRVDNVWEQYTNPDNQPIPYKFQPKEGAASGTEFVSDGPAERFTHDVAYRSIGSVNINGQEHEAFVSTVIRQEIGKPENITKGHELIIKIADGKMISLYLSNDGASSDLPAEFLEARFLERADIAMNKVLASVGKALGGELKPERRTHLEGVQARYEQHLVRLTA